MRPSRRSTAAADRNPWPSGPNNLAANPNRDLFIVDSDNSFGISKCVPKPSSCRIAARGTVGKFAEVYGVDEAMLAYDAGHRDTVTPRTATPSGRHRPVRSTSEDERRE